MTLQVSLVGSGLLNRGELRAWTGRRFRKLRVSMQRAMHSEAPKLRELGRAAVKRAFPGKTKAAGSIHTKIYDRKQHVLPAVKVGSKIPWLGIHERGGRLAGNMLIPFGGVNRPRRFRATIAALLKGGNASIVQVGTHAIVFAENIPENASLIAPFKRFALAQGTVEKRGHSGKLIKRGADVPIALLTRSVTVRRRLKFTPAIKRGLPGLAAAFKRELNHG